MCASPATVLYDLSKGALKNAAKLGLEQEGVIFAGGLLLFFQKIPAMIVKMKEVSGYGWCHLPFGILLFAVILTSHFTMLHPEGQPMSVSYLDWFLRKTSA